MTTPIIKSLQELVTPHILDAVKAYDGNNDSKAGVLNTLYGLVTAKLTDKIAYERVVKLHDNDFDSAITLFDTLFGDEIDASHVDSGEEQDTFLGKLYHSLSEKFNLPLATVSALFLTALPLIFKHLKGVAGSKALPEYLESEREGLFSTLPAWLVGLLPLGFLKAGATSLNATSVPSTPVNPIVDTKPMDVKTEVKADVKPVSEVVSAPATTPPPASYVSSNTTTSTHTTEKKEEGGGFLKGLLPIIGLIILAGLAWLMLKSCQKQPTPVAAPVVEVASADSTALLPASVDLKLNSTGDALASCTAKVGTQTFGEKVRSSIAKVFGAESCELSESKDTAAEMPAEQYLPQVLGFMKGVPDASLNATGKTITLGSSDPVALEKLVSDVKTALPADFEVGTADAGTAAAVLAPATLAVALNDKGDAIDKCDSKVGTGLGDKVRSLVAGVFGAEKCNVAEDANTDTSLVVEPHLPKILELMKGVPNATLDVSGNKLNFGSSDPAALEKLLADVKGVVPADFEVGAGTGADAGTGAAALAPASLSLALNDKGDSIANCESKVGTGLGDKVRSLISGVFGAEKCAFVEDAGTDANLAAEPHLPKILELMKGVPNATVAVDGNKLSFSSTDPKALEKLLADVKGIVPADFEVQATPSESETVAKAVEESSKAIDSLSKEASPEELVKALNLQIINFTTGSNEIPAVNKAVLDKAAVFMKDLPNAQLVITGHTDDRGAADMNKKLSEKRAKAVHDYLVSKGVDDAKLEVKGVGPDEPVASNDTAEGRFKNRRIEFKLMNNGETVADTSKK